MKIESEMKLDFKDVLIKPIESNLNSRSEVNLEREFTFKNNQYWKGVPIIISNMDTTGTFEMAMEASKYKILTSIHKHYSLEDWKSFINNVNIFSKNESIYEYISVTSGISDDDLNKLDKILEMLPNIKFIHLDVANGYIFKFLRIIEIIKKKYPNKILIAGSVVTPEIVEKYIRAGVDIVKVGIGSGSVCTTRKQTGVGYPQLSCVIECSNMAKALGGYILSDGGCTCPGDFAKAYGGGADFVMGGGMFSGHKECHGEIIIENDKQYKLFYGMSSLRANNNYNGGLNQYKSSEGKEVKIEYKGEVKDTILNILGGIRSTCTYTNTRNLKDLFFNTTFIRVSQQLNTIYGN